MKVSIIGGSGYVGGELLRLLTQHPSTELVTVTSKRYSGEPLYRVHPNLRGVTNLRFSTEEDGKEVDSDIVFSALPHGKSVDVVPKLLERGQKVIDMSADFRLKSPASYAQYYGYDHPNPQFLQKAAYGLPELHRDDIRKSRLVAVPGCMATSAILGLAPVMAQGLVDPERIVIDAKIGSSGAGAGASISTHHSERASGVRPYKASGHRHIPEIEQELGSLGKGNVKISFTPHAVGMVRGVLTTTHSFLLGQVEKRDVWKSYRSLYEGEPFIRMVSDNKGLYGLPNPKVVTGTNFCDIGFEIDPHANRLVIFSALDNLTKGAAGQAVQCYNIASGVDESTGLTSLGLHP